MIGLRLVEQMRCRRVYVAGLRALVSVRVVVVVFPGAVVVVVLVFVVCVVDFVALVLWPSSLNSLLLFGLSSLL